MHKWSKFKIVRTPQYDCACVTILAVLIIFCYPPDSHYSENTVYWRTEEGSWILCLYTAKLFGFWTVIFYICLCLLFLWTMWLWILQQSTELPSAINQILKNWPRLMNLKLAKFVPNVILVIHCLHYYYNKHCLLLFFKPVSQRLAIASGMEWTSSYWLANRNKTVVQQIRSKTVE